MYDLFEQGETETVLLVDAVLYCKQHSYYMTTIPCIKDYFMPLQEVICFKFIPSITWGHICSNDKHVLLSLPTRFGGLGIPLFHENASMEFENSRKLTSSLTHLIKDLSVLYSLNGIEQEKIKTTIKTERGNIHKKCFEYTVKSFQLRFQMRINYV